MPPTEVQEETVSPQSNAGRLEQARATIVAAIEQLLAGGKRVMSVDNLASATGMSEVTIRRHLPYLAGRLRLRLVQQRRIVFLATGGQRVYRRMVLVQRGRRVVSMDRSEEANGNGEIHSQAIDQARNMRPIMCLIDDQVPVHRRFRRSPSQQYDIRCVQVV